ncbi:hypothetical protein CHS0354_041434 [Potamilus streckersoni]|uniref:Uncharacterized protein n=1 Tax=Potamilus streckersoni TaxID=2493646 RepID=A0AAE0TAM3_9BIVA|nr:hypothetical protein CHS0354_041434 [Potamilus streckersoni]
MCEVIRDNFEDYFPVIEKAIRRSDFVGIDTEFTGLTIGEQTKPSLFDTGEERYKKLRKCVTQITINQLGLAAFIKDPKENRYEVQSFNLYLFPTTFGPVDVCFTVQASSWEFQSKYNMDFNKMIYHGISFMNEEQHNLVKDHICSHAMNSGQLRVGDEYAAQKICSHIAAWVNYAKEKDKYVVSTQDIQGIKDIFVLSKEIRNRFPLVWTVTDESGNIFVEKVTMETRQQLEQKSAEAQQQEEQKLLESMLGITRIFRVLRECKKPLVGHNMLFDLLLLYDKFYKPLPVSYRQFKVELNSMLPTIFDTKHITNSLRKTMEETGLLDSTTLEDLYIMFKSPKGREHVIHSPDIFHAEGFDRYKTKHVPHEAGYDSFLSGYVFLRMAHILTFQETKSSEVVPCTFRRYLHSLASYTNSINVIRASLSHICLDGPDPPSKRPELLYVKSRHLNKPLNMTQLAGWFSPYGSVDIRLEDKTCAYVAAGNFRCAKDILTAFKGHDTIYVTKYSIWRHSLVVRSLLWAGTLVSGCICLWAIWPGQKNM